MIITLADTAGQERYRAITSAYYRGAFAVIILYDITKHQSFVNAINLWINETKNYANNDVIIALVGNKTDLKHLRAVDTTYAKAEAIKLNMHFFEVSSFDGSNVTHLFNVLTQEVYKKTIWDQQQQEPIPIPSGRPVPLVVTPSYKESQKKCC